jgi:CheY-like chemotaxis protein/HPt (histidine-containing phosphotransfer) domain-containing protein
VRVLVVDDNATNRDVLTRMAAAWGMRPVAASGGPSALAALYRAIEEHDAFRVAIVDRRMPGMDGEGLGRAIRADRRLRDTRLVMLTPDGAAGSAPSPGEAGFASWVPKPVRPRDLHQLLCSLLLGGSAVGPPPAVAVPSAQGRRELPTGFRPRILLAEDNFTNQQVALGILEKLGLRADVVEDGAAAVKALESTVYDVVLMDVRMPVMDGMEAARRIRDPRSKVRNHDIPIIAVTANALASDRAQCLEAGMNGYVTKPVSPEGLIEALRTWCGTSSGARPVAVESPVQPAKEQEAPVYDRKGLERRLMGDRALVERVVKAFLGDMPDQIHALEELLKKGDAAGARGRAHTIKGAASNVGGERLRCAALEIEKLAAAGDMEAARGRMDGLVREFERLRDTCGKEWCTDEDHELDWFADGGDVRVAEGGS